VLGARARRRYVATMRTHSGRLLALLAVLAASPAVAAAPSRAPGLDVPSGPPSVARPGRPSFAAPEIDPSAARSGLAILGAAVLMLLDRRRR
jgi:hypothetical protein